MVARILITSGPTRQYLDPVRYLTNASSGRMGAALAKAAVDLGHDVVVVSGPVDVEYPSQAEVVSVVTTDEMLAACCEIFPDCDGAIGAAAPCDYRPVRVAAQKIAKTGQPLVLHLVETPDVIALLGQRRRADQWLVGFALETKDRHFRAITKMQKKSCQLMVLNGPSAISAADNEVEILDSQGEVVRVLSGSKQAVAEEILQLVSQRLIRKR